MEDQLHKIRHSLSHIMASVIRAKYPAVKLGIGPVIDNGFYYDLDFSGGAAPTSDDFIEIQKAMRKIVAEKQIGRAHV